jgi:secreted PhoX family phosphatase
MAKKTSVSRRSFLSGAALLAGAAATQALTAAKEAQAQQKVPQASVKYQDKPSGDQRCDNCLQFTAPNSCKVVDGTISPSGWCSIWVKKP